MNFGLILAVPAGLVASIVTWRTYGWFAETRATAYRQTPFDRFTARLVAATVIGVSIGMYVERALNPEAPAREQTAAPVSSPPPSREAAPRRAQATVSSAVTAAPTLPTESASAARADAGGESAGTAEPAPRPRNACDEKAMPLERLLCANPELSALEARVSDTYVRALATLDRPEDREALQYGQGVWRKQDLQVCSTADCANKAYQSRISVLSDAFGIR